MVHQTSKLVIVALQNVCPAADRVDLIGLPVVPPDYRPVFHQISSFHSPVGYSDLGIAVDSVLQIAPDLVHQIFVDFG